MECMVVNWFENGMEWNGNGMELNGNGNEWKMSGEYEWRMSGRQLKRRMENGTWTEKG